MSPNTGIQDTKNKCKLSSFPIFSTCHNIMVNCHKFPMPRTRCPDWPACRVNRKLVVGPPSGGMTMEWVDGPNFQWTWAIVLWQDHVYVSCSIHVLICSMSYFQWACLAANGWRVVLPNLNCRKTYGGWGEPGAALDRKFQIQQRRFGHWYGSVFWRLIWFCFENGEYPKMVTLVYFSTEHGEETSKLEVPIFRQTQVLFGCLIKRRER